MSPNWDEFLEFKGRLPYPNIGHLLFFIRGLNTNCFKRLFNISLKNINTTKNKYISIWVKANNTNAMIKDSAGDARRMDIMVSNIRCG